jgi:hypothetical protein
VVEPNKDGFFGFFTLIKYGFIGSLKVFIKIQDVVVPVKLNYFLELSPNELSYSLDRVK